MRRQARKIPTVVIPAILLCLLFGRADAALLHNDRASFEGLLGASVIDDYNRSRYSEFVYSDTAISAIFAETAYQSTGFANVNVITNGEYYCAGCNGSFLLDFTSTSVGSTSGVFGVGFEIVGYETVIGTTAFVTFGDASTANFAIPDATPGQMPFWGITADLSIMSIHFGLPDGGVNTDPGLQRMALDNLTIGAPAAIPLPAAIWLFASALIGLCAFGRRARG